jgi:glutathione S-transferase
MKLYHAAASPFVRKVRVTAAELGLEGRIEQVDVATTPVKPDPKLKAANPLNKIPALMTDDGELLYDSPVICEYLAATAGNGDFLPAAGKARWTALRLQALGDGIMDAAVLRRYEDFLRPKDKFWPDWDAAQKGKVTGALDALEADAAALEGPVTIGTVTVACALGYLDFRFAAEDWRQGRPKLAAWYETMAKRPSMAATAPG